MKTDFILKGNICYSETMDRLRVAEQQYVICVDGKSAGVFSEIPEKYQGLPVKDCGDALIVPGLVDLHAHAPQYAFRGLGMDLELLEWLNTHTFPEEAKYSNEVYAKRAYTMYVEELKKSDVTRAVIFATMHVEGTKILMELLENSGLSAYVGKVNMDRNGGKDLEEKSAEKSLEETKRWLAETDGRFRHVRPILTPRFIPSCTDELMRGLAELQREKKLPVQSHLSENPGEIAWVKELCPNVSNYSEAYEQFGLFGGDCPTIMAHCIWMEENEIEKMKNNQVYVAHCPQSNMNLSSGIAPVRRFLSEGIPTGLGSDMAAGYSTSIFRAMADAIQCSKMRWRLVDDTQKPLTVEETFYLGTKGGGAFFGKVGSFEEGYEFDALILDDSNIAHPQELTVRDRLERMIYLSDDRHITEKYVSGRKVK